MDFEALFKTVLVVTFSGFSLIRIRYQILAQRAGYRTVIQESKKYSVLLSLLICYEVFTIFVHLWFRELIEWAYVPLPLVLPWLGVFLGISSLILFIWVHHNLGGNFSMTLRIADRHNLVESGPYYWMRHPMYTAFFLLHVAAFLLTANWLIGVSWLAGLSAIVALRVRREESMMIDRFGTEYISYMQRTGRFLPVTKGSRSILGVVGPRAAEAGVKCVNPPDVVFASQGSLEDGPSNPSQRHAKQ